MIILKDWTDITSSLSVLEVNDNYKHLLSIPGEEILLEFDKFSLYSTRISNGYNMSINVQGISVFIPNDVLDQQTNRNRFEDSLDVIIYGIITGETIVNISEQDRECEGYGTLSRESLSITGFRECYKYSKFIIQHKISI